MNFTSSDKIIKVVNKIDLNKNLVKDVDVKISAKTGEGIDLLFSMLKEKPLETKATQKKRRSLQTLDTITALRNQGKIL